MVMVAVPREVARFGNLNYTILCISDDARRSDCDRRIRIVDATAICGRGVENVGINVQASSDLTKNGVAIIEELWIVDQWTIGSRDKKFRRGSVGAGTSHRQ